MGSLSSPYAGLPTFWIVVFTVGFAVTAGMVTWTLLLYVRRMAIRPAHAPQDAADAFEWVFLVPALDEEVTVGDSVSRLMSLPVARRHVVVIDDGSTDRTPTILAELPYPELHVLRRDPPEARVGKAAALNHAYRELGGMLGQTVDRERVIVVIVDADGRLDRDAPRFAAPHFADPRVGGVQSRVRIYNRDRPVTWLQDVEFGVYGRLYQEGRSLWGTSGMGGNGQFNRLAALDAVVDHRGPWRDRLTEDQDLGLRLIGAGWLCRQEDRAVIEQQGVPNLRRLLRQRTRWFQGGLQALALVRVVLRAPFPLVARLELLVYLLMPLWETIIGIGLVGAIVLFATGLAGFWGDGSWWQLAFFYVLAIGGALFGCIARSAGDGVRGVVRGFVVAHPYALYSWLIWPVLVRAVLRQLTEQRGWAKTEREPLGAELDA